MNGFVGHNGGLPGFVDIAMYNPEDGTTVVLMMNIQPGRDATLGTFKKIVGIIEGKTPAAAGKHQERQTEQSRGKRNSSNPKNKFFSV